MKIVQHPNKILSTPTSLVDLDDSELVETIADALFGAYAELSSNKVGLAANQIGLGYNTAIVLGNLYFNLEFNPVKYQKEFFTEGCYSINNANTFFPRVERPSYGWAKYWDYTEKKYIERKLTAFEARVYQHELDHLQGKLCNQI